ncbi:hypothetical protein Tco_1106872 [Tanacetum coccineum]
MLQGMRTVTSSGLCHFILLDKNLRTRGHCMDLGRTQEKLQDKYCHWVRYSKLDMSCGNLKGQSDFLIAVYGNVKSSKPKTLDETIDLANDLMDQKLRTYAEKSDNKRKADDSSPDNHEHQQQPSRGRMLPGGKWLFELWRRSGHFKRDCPKLKNKDGGNGNAQGWVYAVGNAEKRGNASGNLDSNVITGTFLLNNHYASILFDTGADRSFISIAFSSLIDIVPTPLDNSYDVELADGKIAQEYMAKGCQVFLAQISAKKEEDKSEGKQLKDVPIVRDFPEVFPEDLPGLPLGSEQCGILIRLNSEEPPPHP